MSLPALTTAPLTLSWRAKDGKPEIDFETDVYDFRLPSIQIEELKKGLKSSGSLRAEENIPDMHYSLRVSGEGTTEALLVMDFAVCPFPSHIPPVHVFIIFFILQKAALPAIARNSWTSLAQTEQCPLPALYSNVHSILWIISVQWKGWRLWW